MNGDMDEESRKNLEWFAEADLSAYAGQFVVIACQQVAAAGEDLEPLLEEAKRRFPNSKVVVHWELPPGNYALPSAASSSARSSFRRRRRAGARIVDGLSALVVFLFFL